MQVVLGDKDAKGALSERLVHPLGLASKGTTWYLVGDTGAGGGHSAVWRVTSAQLTDELAERPAGFDLQKAWDEIVATIDVQRGLRHVTVSWTQGCPLAAGALRHPAQRR